MKRVLSTKTLDASDITLASSLGLDIQCVDFIETQPIGFNVESILEDKYDTLIFTSANAVNYFFEKDEAASMVEGKKIFSIGYKTADALSDYNIRIKMAADNASELADEIIQNRLAKSVLHICGDKTLDILKVKLEYAGIGTGQLVVYKTVLLNPQLARNDFDAIMFFSPSGVESFFASNKLASNALCCCIGSTTADALNKRNAGANVVISKHPTAVAMIDAIEKYFTKHESVISLK